MSRPPPGASRRDASPGVAVLGVGCVLATAALGMVVAAGVGGLFDHAAIPALPLRPSVPPPPRLEVAGGGALDEVRARALAKLSGYGWADAAHTRARIPLDRAMAITAQRGWSDPEPTP
jgi:hypothetical protein